MNPRRSPLPLTQQDRWLWERVAARQSGLRSLSLVADARDADLMWGILRMRAEGWYQPLATYFREGRENVERALGGRLR